ncbi:BRI1 kinase inhibitor 1 [Glycine max]|uniref:BRI1 kinase inhibitor 1 n=1 Tax=Glycine soja TaxID=3848 RepID=A0A445K4B9_GLYSO|nr:BRI1 kinase inhibitor 1-like [Glycine soja]KAH1244430.1 BRI1 kinase inhibitor 1 [Glycine max]KHN22313.1 BRI1 kinase inhibitor 1 [Glycine soja]RZC05672.1 BRI1 kinase inhibitor 1 [Glycine soja]
METHHQPQKNKENDVQKKTEEGVVAKPPSPSSSPSHEFSFTISLHSSSNTTIQDKSKTPPSLAVDLSPADDIFFHGHLLPLHLLSHFSSSPRFSTNSVDSFTLPIREFLEDEKRNSSNRSNITIDSITSCNNKDDYYNNRVTKEESKSKPSFSLFGLSKGRKGCQVRDNKEDKEDNIKHKKKLGYDVMHALKKYLRMVQPLVLFRGRREKGRFHGQAYSHSGNLIRKNKPEVRGRRGEYSAPASMRTSPTNSGLLLATTALPPANDSTMEELQAAIQAAIAHCKNSIAKEEKLSC